MRASTNLFESLCRLAVAASREGTLFDSRTTGGDWRLPGNGSGAGPEEAGSGPVGNDGEASARVVRTERRRKPNQYRPAKGNPEIRKKKSQDSPTESGETPILARSPWVHNGTR